jgi:hypothetical protein
VTTKGENDDTAEKPLLLLFDDMAVMLRLGHCRRADQ